MKNLYKNNDYAFSWHDFSNPNSKTWGRSVTYIGNWYFDKLKQKKLR